MNSKEVKNFNHVSSLQISWNKSFGVISSQLQEVMAVGISLATSYGELLALIFLFLAYVFFFFLTIIIGKIKLHFIFFGSVGNKI